MSSNPKHVTHVHPFLTTVKNEGWLCRDFDFWKQPEAKTISMCKDLISEVLDGAFNADHVVVLRISAIEESPETVMRHVSEALQAVLGE